MTDILAYSDSPRLASELATAADSLAKAAGGRPLVVELDRVREAARGPVALVRSEGSLSTVAESAAAAISALVERRGAQVVLVGSTRFGRMVAGRLSVMRRWVTLGDVNELQVEAGHIRGTRGVYAGKFRATVEAETPCVVLVPQGSYEASQSPAEVADELVLPPAAPRVRTIEARTGTGSTSSLDLRSAKVIVAAGRGFAKKEDLALAEGLAKALGGHLGASRPLSSDLGWLGEEYHIGLTGVYVHPDLYVAVGISGQLQHVAGIRDSRVIVAINKDPQAPIFQVADYGVVGDLYEVVPALVRILGG